MLCDRVLGNLTDGPALARDGAIVEVPIPWHDCWKRAQRLTAADGTILRLLLPPAAYLRHRDLLARVDQFLYVVDVPSVNLLRIYPPDGSALAAITYELGDLHLPVEIVDRVILTLPDGPAESIARRYHATTDQVHQRFTPLRPANPATFELSSTFKII